MHEVEHVQVSCHCSLRVGFNHAYVVHASGCDPSHPPMHQALQKPGRHLWGLESVVRGRGDGSLGRAALRIVNVYLVVVPGGQVGVMVVLVVATGRFVVGVVTCEGVRD